MSRTTYSTPIIGEFRDFLDPYDEWASAMEWWFAIAETMHYLDEPTPAEWGFSAAGGGRGLVSVDELVEEFGHAAEVALEATPDDRRKAGRILSLWVDVLRDAGKSY